MDTEHRKVVMIMWDIITDLQTKLFLASSEDLVHKKKPRLTESGDYCRGYGYGAP
jgi:hypothetical protein